MHDADDSKRVNFCGLLSHSHSVQVALGVAPADGQASEMTPPLSELVSLLPVIQAGILHLLAVSEQSDFAVP